MIQKPWAKSTALKTNNTKPPPKPPPMTKPQAHNQLNIQEIIEKATPPPKTPSQPNHKLRTWTFKKLKTETLRLIRRNTNNYQNTQTYTAQAKLLQQAQGLTPTNVAILMQITADNATKTSRQNVKTKLNEIERRLNNLTNGQTHTIIE